MGSAFIGSWSCHAVRTSLSWGKELCYMAGSHLQRAVFVPLTPAHRSSSSSSPPTSWVSAAAAPCTTSSTSGISTRCPTYSGAPLPPSSPTCPSMCCQGGGPPACWGGRGPRGAAVCPPHADPRLSPLQGAAAGCNRALLEHLPLHGLQLPLPPHLPRTCPAPALVWHGPSTGTAHPPAGQEACSHLQEGPVRAGLAGQWELASGTSPFPARLLGCPGHPRRAVSPGTVQKGQRGEPPMGRTPQ